MTFPMVDDSGWRAYFYLHGDPLEETGGWPGWVEPPYPPVDIGPCSVCGHPTKRSTTWRSRRETATGYACVWCQAAVDVFHTGPPGHTPTSTRPSYAPPDQRWNEDFGGEPRRYHASGHWRLTLCGLDADDLTGSDAQWRPGRTDACPGCLTAAAEIDARWPADRRTGGTFIVACPCHVCRSLMRAGR
ncbi:hypothetical protein [Streptosporangium sp. NPDC002721]|uniref:hypothetical protein n=1 Tax=Streptosporangium sp. NPDC002721 TaxID=3366188 RepID=UPI00367D19B3